MTGKTRLYEHGELAAALGREDPNLPLPDLSVPDLVDLRHKDPLLARTQVLDEDELRQLRAEYEALRQQQPVVSEPRASELTARTTLALAPRRYRVIGALLAIAVALGSWSVCRSWMTGGQVARAATQAAPVVAAMPVLPTVPAREPPGQPPAASAPRAAVNALASGDREAARRVYDELARHEEEPGPYAVAAQILAGELRAAD
jgi:hypothetical protein